MTELWSRRTFLKSVAGAGVAPWALAACGDGDPQAGAGGTEERDTPVAAFTFDLHTHPGAFYLRGLPGYVGDEAFSGRIADMAAAAMSAAFVSIVADAAILERTETGIRQAREFEAGEAWGDYRRQMGHLGELIETVGAELALDLAGADAARSSESIAAFVAVEGGDFLEGDIGRLSQAYQDGVRSIQLVHYAQNDIGDLQTAPPVHQGLSPFGVELVDGMVELGMAIDVAHAALPTVEAVAERAGVPLVLSHTLLDTPARPHPRHISAEHARLIAETGGVIGLWPSGFGSESLDEFVGHSLRLIDLVGVDHVGLGTDMDGNYLPVIASYGDYSAWRDALGAGGLSSAEVAQLAGGNARRVLETVLV